MLHNFNSWSRLPRSVVFILRTIVFIFDKRWYLATGLMATFLMAFIASEVVAMCDTIPERRQSLCEQLGYAPECDLRFENGKRIHGVLEITVDDYVSEPDVVPFLPDVRATAVRLTTKDAEAVQIYLPLPSLGGGQLELSLALLQAPCAFITCVQKRERDPYHQGLSEEQLVDFDQAVNHVIFQTGDSLQIEEFRVVYGSVGIPTITWVDWNKGEMVDQTKTSLASVLRVPVTIEFALPAKE